jgi:hypothetical protein
VPLYTKSSHFVVRRNRLLLAGLAGSIGGFAPIFRAALKVCSHGVMPNQAAESNVR